MSETVGVPPGYRRIERVGDTVLLRLGLVGPDVDALSDPGVWDRAGFGHTAGSGRGSTVRLPLAGGGAAILKRMRRGGLLARFWRDRFAGTRRLLDNLRVPDEAARRGVPTPEPLALRVVPGPAGLYRAWLAVRAVDDSEDLRARLARTPPPDEHEIAAVLQAIRRMHDAGIFHPDLNLGNLLMRAGTIGPEAWVLDLDRATVTGSAPLSAAPRIRSLRRLERSYAKEFGDTGPLGQSPLASWLRVYAPADSALDRAVRRAAERPPQRRRLRRWWWKLRGEGARARLGD